MPSEDTYIQFEGFNAGRLTIETAVELEEPNPAIFVEIFDEEGGTVSARFTTDPKALDIIADKLKEVAKKSREESGEYWRKMNP